MFKNNKLVSAFFFINGSSFVFFLLLIFLLTLIGYIFNIPINKTVFFMSVFLNFIYLFLANYYSFRKSWLKFFSLSFVLFTFIFIFSYSISSIFSDLSFDGQSYHQEAIIQLKNGWNPLKHSIKPDVWDHTYTIWLNHFPKFSWITSAVIYETFNNIEIGKMVNLLLIAACFLIVFSILSYKRKTYFKNLFFSGLLAFNPISISQFSSFYIDNQISSLIFIFAFLIYFVFIKDSFLLYVFLGIVTICMLNIKITLIAYTPIFYLFALLISLILKRKNIFKKLLITSIISGFLSIFVFGFHPYVTTFIRYRNPFYPMYTFYPIKDLSNKEKLESVVPALPYVTNIREFIYESNMPKNFSKKNQLEKFFYSIFSYSSNLIPYLKDGKEISNDTAKLKVPFLFDKNELIPFTTADTRIGGFGPFFSGALILSMVIFGFIFWENKKFGLIILIINFGLLVSALLNSELWWARYVPQIWLIPITILFSSFYLMQKHRKIFFLSLILISALYLNIFGISYKSIKYQYLGSKYRQKYFQSLANQVKQTNLPILVEFGSLRANRIIYKQSQIPYLEKSLEVGVLENHIFPKITNDNKKFLLEFYKKDMKTYKYNLEEAKIGDTDLKKISSILEKNDTILNTD